MGTRTRLTLNPDDADRGDERGDQVEHVVESAVQPEVQPGVPVVLPSTTPGCTFLLANGPCGKKVRARGFCHNHYKVLARRKAFEVNQPAWGTTLTKRTISRNQRALDKARELIERAAPVFAEHMIAASERAAMKGRSGPAEWGLLHSRAIEPVKAEQPTGAQGVKVYVGFNLGGANPGAALTSSADPSTQVPRVQVVSE